jgi:hypothetical protein
MRRTPVDEGSFDQPSTSVGSVFPLARIEGEKGTSVSEVLLAENVSKHETACEH